MTTDEAAEMAARYNVTTTDGEVVATLSQADYDALKAAIENPEPPTPALVKLMRSTAPTGEMVMVSRALLLELRDRECRGCARGERLGERARGEPFHHNELGCSFGHSPMAQRLCDALSSSPHPTPEGEGTFTATHRHVRTDATYMVIAHGNDCTNKNAKLVPIVIYRNQYGAWWVREAAEFEDGRFQRLIEPPSVPEPFTTPDAARVIEVMRRALEPFVNALTEREKHWPFGQAHDGAVAGGFGIQGCDITYGDLRRARAALTAAPEGQGAEAPDAMRAALERVLNAAVITHQGDGLSECYLCRSWADPEMPMEHSANCAINDVLAALLQSPRGKG